MDRSKLNHFNLAQPTYYEHTIILYLINLWFHFPNLHNKNWMDIIWEKLSLHDIITFYIPSCLRLIFILFVVCLKDSFELCPKDPFKYFICSKFLMKRHKTYVRFKEVFCNRRYAKFMKIKVQELKISLHLLSF